MVQDVGVSAKRDRRRFTAAYKLQILQQVERCRAPGEVGALLRREGLYSSHLATWRAARRRGELAGLAQRLFALEEDVQARAVGNDLAKAVDYAAFVELSLHYDKVNSWL